MRLDLIRFDLTRGLPAALRGLRRSLAPKEFRRALRAFVRRSITDDPFGELDAPANKGEEFTRHQLKPALLLDTVLREDLGWDQERTHTLLRDVVGETGAAFIEATLAPPSSATWFAMNGGDRQKFAEGVLQKFENAEGAIVEAGAKRFGVDMTFCHFVALTHRLGRSDLAPLFCHADSVYFGRPDSEIHLDRDETLAGGEQRCSFRFSFREQSDDPAQ